KFPIGGRPFDAIPDATDPVKTNAVRGHEVERLMKIGQGSLSFDPSDHALHVQQFGRRAKKWFAIGVETENVVSETFADVKKVTGATAKIENAQGRRTVEPEVLRALDVDVDPINDVFET